MNVLNEYCVTPKIVSFKTNFKKTSFCIDQLSFLLSEPNTNREQSQ